jgi:hypothetical protein
MKVVPKFRKLIAALSTLAFLVSLAVPHSASAAYTVAPQIGQCFQYTRAQVSASYPSKNPISCSSLHNSETFEVVDWPLKTNPVDMVHDDALAIAYEYCSFWETFPNASKNKMSKTQFNYWAWYTPNRAAWARGERWLRCDAMVGNFKSSSEWPPTVYVSWRGSKL